MYLRTACVFLLFVGSVACNKVIDIDVREADIKYVIEGVVTNEAGKSGIKIGRSKNFNERNDFEKISGAAVRVFDNEEEFVMTESEPGFYSNALLNGVAGHVYRMEITAGGQTFSAASTMPQLVTMDSLYVSRGPFGQFKFATIVYSDPAGLNNGYRFVQFVNGVKEPTVFWENDEFTDGQSVTMQLDASADEKDDPRNIKTGDEVTVEMQTVDEPVFEFWYSLRSGGGDGDGFAAAPSNPVSNIVGGALGYFSAHAVDRRSVIAD